VGERASAVEGVGGLSGALDRLRDTLGRDRILERPLASEEIQRRSLNPAGDAAPQLLLCPQNTEECRIVVEVLGSVGCYPDPIGSLTTFWEPHPRDAEVGIDTLGLRAPARIAVQERIGYFGAGVTVREADRLARAEGLCLLAYPDSDGTASVGSMAAVGCTSGLGLGRVQPVEQIAGLTVVTREATVLRTGVSWRRGHGGVAHGMPDPTGIFLGSQGRFGVITEVILTLAPAPFLAARSWWEPWRAPEALADALRRARLQIDQGTVDSLRLETTCAGGTQATATEWLLRCWAPGSSDAADRRSATVARDLGARDARSWVESDAGRRGDLPDHDARYSLPPGSHHERTGRAGFLGMEVNVNWGDQLDAALRVFADLFAALGTLPLGHRRLGIYPGRYTVAIGAQAMLAGGEATPDMVRSALARFVEPLSVIGALPYRPGRLWRQTLDRQESEDPACALIRRAGLAGRPS